MFLSHNSDVSAQDLMLSKDGRLRLRLSVVKRQEVELEQEQQEFGNQEAGHRTSTTRIGTPTGGFESATDRLGSATATVGPKAQRRGGTRIHRAEARSD